MQTLVPKQVEIDSAFIRSLSDFFPSDRLHTSASQLAVFASDGLTAFSVQPRAIVVPITEQELVQTIQLCCKHAVPFVARGSGTSLSGGSLPHADGIVIALNRMNRILHIDPIDCTAVVQPGAINLAVSRAAEEYGLHFAPDPSSQQVCTIGGNVAFNAGGAHCLKYGMTSNHILGMRVVLGDGTVVVTGSASIESIGPDLTGLIVGSEGTLGVVSEITVRLMPRPESYFTVMLGYASVEEAGDAVSAIIEAGILPAAMEIMDRVSMKAAEAGVGAHYPEGAEAVLIVELDGTRWQVEEERQQLEQVLERTNRIATEIAHSAEERMLIWKGRKSVFSAVGRLSPDFIVQDGVVPRNRLGLALREIAAISQAFGVPVANVFHAGDGNLHPLIMFDGRVAGALERAEQVAARIVQVCIDLGGSITGEHGVGMEKRSFMNAMFDDPSLDLMHRIRMACDPKLIANRDKMFPSADAPAMSMYGLHPLEQAGIVSRE